MNKPKKFPFGRKTAIGVSIAFQISIIAAAFIVMNIYFVIFRYISAALFILAVFSVILRKMPFESKMSWLILLFFVPFFGLTVYLLLSHTGLSRSKRRLLDDFREQERTLTPCNKDLERFLTCDELSQADYIESATECCGYINTEVKYYPYGETVFADYLNDLERAKEFIFMEYFLVANGEMFGRVLPVLKKKAADGVDVRVIYDDFGSVNRIQKSFAEQMEQYGIKVVVFNKMIPLAAPFQNIRDHRKITVIDGKIGYTGGVNLADEYINVINPYGVWKDTMIRLKGPAVDRLTMLFLTNYCVNVKISESLDRFVGRSLDCASRGVVIPYGNGPKPIYKQRVAENVYINLINSAQRYIWISTPYLICDGRLKKSLKSAAARGVDVRIVMPHIPDKKLIFTIGRSNYKSLQRSGVKIYEYEPGFIHAKQAVCDGVKAVVGTANLDYRSLLYNFENGVLMFNTDCISDIEADFNSVFMRSVSMDGFKQNVFITMFCKMASLFQPLL